LARVFLTKLRRSYIIKTLLDSNEWHTQEILKEIGDLEYEHYCYHHPPINHYEFSNFRPDNIEPVNNPKLSIILGNLVKEGIIETRAISRFEKESSRGSRGNVYWLVKSNKALYSILKDLDSNFDKLNLVSSDYGKKLINLDLVNEITKILNPLWTEEDRQFILATLRISPTALYNSLKAYFIEDDYWFKGCAPISDEEVRLYMKEKFLMDLKFWLYNDMQTTPLRGREDIRVIFDVSVFIRLNNKEFKQNSINESFEPLIYPTQEEILERQLNIVQKPIELLWLENAIESLQRTVYDSLRVISEEKGKEKNHKKEELIKEYYIQIDKLIKKIKPLRQKYGSYY